MKKIKPKPLTMIVNPDFNPNEGLLTTADRTVVVGLPSFSGSYAFRVPVSDNQAVIGFPKFGTIGIGFEKETDGNTNLPYEVPADEIADHISHNRLAGGDNSVSRYTVVEAINMIRHATGLLDRYGKKCRGCKMHTQKAIRENRPDPNSDIGPHWQEDCFRYPRDTGSTAHATFITTSWNEDGEKVVTKHTPPPTRYDDDGWPIKKF